jgi:hypothetical protein
MVDALDNGFIVIVIVITIIGVAGRKCLACMCVIFVLQSSLFALRSSPSINILHSSLLVFRSPLFALRASFIALRSSFIAFVLHSPFFFSISSITLLSSFVMVELTSIVTSSDNRYAAFGRDAYSQR